MPSAGVQRCHKTCARLVSGMINGFITDKTGRQAITIPGVHIPKITNSSIFRSSHSGRHKATPAGRLAGQAGGRPTVSVESPEPYERENWAISSSANTPQINQRSTRMPGIDVDQYTAAGAADVRGGARYENV